MVEANRVYYLKNLQLLFKKSRQAVAGTGSAFQWGISRTQALFISSLASSACLYLPSCLSLSVAKMIPTTLGCMSTSKEEGGKGLYWPVWKSKTFPKALIGQIWITWLSLLQRRLGTWESDLGGQGEGDLGWLLDQPASTVCHMCYHWSGERNEHV